MSHEFYQILVGAPSMSLYSWKQLARWSIDYSCLDPNQQKECHRILTKAWKEFCKYVVDTYDDLRNDAGEIDEARFEARFKARCSKSVCAKPK
jgi:adenosine deaminase CECR1